MSKPRLNPALTPASANILRLMIEGNEELVCEGRLAYVGSTRVSRGAARRLFEEALVKDVSDNVRGACRRYVVKPEAKQALADPDYETRLQEFRRTRQPVYR